MEPTGTLLAVFRPVYLPHTIDLTAVFTPCFVYRATSVPEISSSFLQILLYSSTFVFVLGVFGVTWRLISRDERSFLTVGKRVGATVVYPLHHRLQGCIALCYHTGSGGYGFAGVLFANLYLTSFIMNS